MAVLHSLSLCCFSPALEPNDNFFSGNGGSTDTANTARRFLGEKRKQILNIVQVSLYKSRKWVHIFHAVHTGCLKAKSPILTINSWVPVDDDFMHKVPF